jgi:FtsZ-binding cell division protein ZapB
VRDPNGSLPKQAWDTAKFLVQQQLPWDSVKGLYDLAKGTATDLDKDKIKGSLTGFTFSQGHPGGPEAAVAAQTNERFEAAKKYVRQQVRDDLKAGEVDAAVEKMQAIGMTAREIRSENQKAEAPKSGLSKQAREKFERRANDLDREEMDMQRGRSR